MWRTLAAVALGVAGAMYVTSHRPLTPTADPDDPGWMRLPNGLRFIVRPVEGATDVAVLTQFDIGSDHDPDGRSGLAHLTEHLYMTSAAGATPARTADEWAKKYGRYHCEATTSPVVTRCLTKVPPGSLEDEIADAAARMSDLRIEASDLERERPRVLQQIAEGDAARAGLEPGPAGWVAAVSRIRSFRGGGVPGEVEAISLGDVRERAHRFYGPANARLVVAGAVDASTAGRLVTKHFGGLPGGERAPPAMDRRLPNPGGRVDVESGKAEPGAPVERSVWIAWPGPSRDDPDSAAMLLLERRAGPPDGDYKRQKFRPMSFVAEGVVLLCWVGDGESAGETPVDDVVKASDELVARFVREPPSADEIDRMAPDAAPGHGPWDLDAKFPEMIAYGLADEASRNRSPQRIRKDLASLTKDDLARVAAKWLGPGNRVVAVARGPVSPPIDDDKMPPYFQEVRRQILKDIGEPDGPPARSAPPGLPSRELIPEIRVALKWDEATQTVHRWIGGVDTPKDDDLEKAIRDAHDAWADAGYPDAPVTIDGDPRIPWSQVTGVVDIVKRCGIDKVEFAMGAPPKPDEGGK